MNDQNGAAQEKKNGEEALETDAEALREELVTLAADFENFRKEIAQSVVGAERFARASVVRSLAPALDSFALALKNGEGNVDGQYLKGFQKVYEQFVAMFAAGGIVRIPAEGSYDPKFHEAVERVPGEAYRIVEEVGTGWMFKDDEQVIVPSKVKVGRG